MPKKLDLTGKTFGRWKVLSAAPTPAPGKTCWNCICTCGTHRIVTTSSLKSGDSNSCGCLKLERTRQRMTTHGMSRSPEHIAWKAMIGRCHNPNNQAYHRYGGRGIEVCALWRKSFISFYDHIGAKPSEYHEVDRIDNRVGYQPGNVRWALPVQQARNKGNNRIIKLDGKSMCSAEWAERVGINRNIIEARLKLGWPIRDALVLPIKFGVHWKDRMREPRPRLDSVLAKCSKLQSAESRS